MKLLYCATIVALLPCCDAGGQTTEVAATAGADDRHERISYPTPNPALGERLYPDEEQLARQIGEVIAASVSRRAAHDGKAVRDAHPKAHGCVTASFRVEDDLSFDGPGGRTVDLARGAFKPGAVYDAWVRFSNSDADPARADTESDGRGMAVRLLGVPGEKLLRPAPDEDAQDFIMISHPVFMIDDPADYLSLTKGVNPASPWERVLGLLRVPIALGVQGVGNARAITSLRIANPLQTRYWSMVPYQLGTGEGTMAVKYSARSCVAQQDPIPSNVGHDYLRAAMRDTLRNGDACMEFLVQPRTDASQDVEDSRTEWTEAEAPFYKVATIAIPRQEFDTPERNDFCENIAFNPWHALPEHRPLGAVNRMRKVIYPEISFLRKSLNAAPTVDSETK